MGFGYRSLVVTSALFLSLLGGASAAYAAGVEPSGAEPLCKPHPNKPGEFLCGPRFYADITLFYDADSDTVAGSARGTCQGHKLVLGPLFWHPPETFEMMVDNLADSDFATEDHPELVDIHPSCLPPDEILVGFRVAEVVRFMVRTDLMVVARVVLLPLHPEP